MSVVALGDTDIFTEHELVLDAVEQRGGETHVVPVQQWPGDTPISYDPVEGTCRLDDPVPTGEVSGVFSMVQSMFPAIPDLYDWFDEKPNAVAYRQVQEWQSALRSLLGVFEERGADVVVSPKATYWDDHRPWMLELYDDEGIPVPETTFTNDPERVRAFVTEHSKAVVHPVNGGATPEVLRPSDLEEDRLAKLSTAPVKLQEYVPGTDTRGYVVDGEFVGMIRYEYDADAESFKSPDVAYDDVGSTSIDPGPELRETVLQAAELCPSPYAVVDVRLADDGPFTVIESNVPGRFAYHDSNGVTDVSGAIAEYLLGS